MSFASYEFLFAFLPFALAVVLAAEAIDRERLFLPALIFVSIVFYGWGSAPHLLLLLGMVLLTFIASNLYVRAPARWIRRTALVLGVVGNLSALTVWKYGNSMVEMWNQIGIAPVEQTYIIMPLGISFYAFQQVGYLMDIRRGRAKLMRPIPFLAFVLFFPQLIAGPIVTQRRMGRELQSAVDGKPVETRLQLAWLGAAWFSMGLFKKVVIADNVGRLIAPSVTAAIYGEPSTLAAWQVALGAQTYIYFDFCGYSDMAVGLALFFGIRIPPNFNAPYRSKNAREFWTRWHITFHHFVRDHLYGPLKRRLGGWKIGGWEAGTAFALMMTVIMSSLWHGNSVQFMLWGLLLYLSIVVTGRMFGWLGPKLQPIVSTSIMVGLILMMGVLFITPDLGTGLRLITSTLNPTEMSAARDLEGWGRLLILAGLLVVVRYEVSTQVLLEAKVDHRERTILGRRLPVFSQSLPWIVFVGALFAVSIHFAGHSPEFVYFGI